MKELQFKWHVNNVLKNNKINNRVTEVIKQNGKSVINHVLEFDKEPTAEVISIIYDVTGGVVKILGKHVLGVEFIEIRPTQLIHNYCLIKIIERVTDRAYMGSDRDYVDYERSVTEIIMTGTYEKCNAKLIEIEQELNLCRFLDDTYYSFFTMNKSREQENKMVKDFFDMVFHSKDPFIVRAMENHSGDVKTVMDERRKELHGNYIIVEATHANLF